MTNTAADMYTRAWETAEGDLGLPAAVIRPGDVLVGDDGVTVEVESVGRTAAGVLLCFTDASSPLPVSLGDCAPLAVVTFFAEDGPTVAPVGVEFGPWVASVLRAFLTGPTGAGLPAGL